MDTSISVVIPNWNGAALLAECLDSVAAIDYPTDRLEVIVVDDGSTDGSLELMATEYPHIRVVAHEANLGFAAACNTGARHATSECVAFLNNDMRVDVGWARGLATAYDAARGYVCVAGVILDWSGVKIDFAGGWMNFHGYVGHENFGKPVAEDRIEDGRDLLFACGGSMLVQRAVFLDVGGFDPTYFAFFEDVDLGWRLWLLGYKVRLASRARSFHRHHATVSSLSFERREYLYERNSLLTLIKNLSDENLAPILAPSLFLLIKRSLLGVRAPIYGANGFAGSGDTVVPLRAADDVLGELDRVLEQRREVQRRRRRADREIFSLFHQPFTPLLLDESYVDAGRNLRAAFDLDEVLSPVPSAIRWRRPLRLLRSKVRG